MKVRWISLALFALLLATAFAPAPFGRKHRQQGTALLLARFQGKWKIEKKERMGPKNELTKMSTTQRVVIENSSWRYTSSFEGKGGKGKAPKGGFGGKAKGREKVPTRRYEVVFTPGTSPPGFRLVRGTNEREDYMVGILAFEGDTVRLLYRMVGTEEAVAHWPTDFETIPEGWYRMTLRREK